MLKYGLAYKNQRDRSAIARKAATAKWDKYQGKGYEPRPIQINSLASIFSILKVDPVKEHRFHDTRRWRFDYAFPDIKLAVEYEGIFSGKSRHTTLKGYDGDAEKYNEAVLLGWRVLRVTALSLRDGRAFRQIEQALKPKEE